MTDTRPAMGSDAVRMEGPIASGHLLSVRDLVVRFRTHDGTVYAVNGVSFDLDEGETLGLVGESGCGKSVTNLAVMRLLPRPAGHIEGGHVIFEGEDLTKLPEEEMREIRGRDIAMIFQDPMTSLNPVLTIEEQMVETIRSHRRVSRAQAKGRAVELLAMVGIPQPAARLRDYPHQFSGGMRQRVMIAMALALEPKILIADEPTTALDVTIQAQVLELLQRLTTEHGTAVILITHDLGVVAGMTSRINVMYAGHVVETASTADLFGQPHHPYTVGLLHSMPRLDAQPGEPLIPIEGTPPDLRLSPVGCPFAPRCAWRLDVCWTEMPALDPVDAAYSRVAAATGHRAACWNQPTPDEVTAGLPLREGFVAAPPPEMRAAGGVSIIPEPEAVVFGPEGGPETPLPGAHAVPVPPGGPSTNGAAPSALPGGNGDGRSER